MNYGRELRYFLLLDRSEQEAAIRRLMASGMPAYTIAAATGLSVEQVRRILAATTNAEPA
jgi:DNA invertase Pin-like site-specific DNA recombinase